jgi:hypothetical protein
VTDVLEKYLTIRNQCLLSSFRGVKSSGTRKEDACGSLAQVCSVHSGHGVNST